MRTRTAALLLVALLVSACGTRLPDSAFVESQGSSKGQKFDDGGSGLVVIDPGSDSGDAGGTGGSGTGGGGGSGTTGSGTGSGTGSTGTGSGTGGVATGPNQASDVGITATSITLGTIVAENGVLGDAFAPAARGLRAWTAATNAKGGINGRRVILKTCDDREDRSRALECARRLIEQDKVFAMVATNTRAFGGAAQYINDKGVPVIGIPITNSFYRYQHLWSGYPSGYVKDNKTVGYKGKLMSLSGGYRWYKRTLGISKAAVFAYDIDESKQAGDFIAKGLELEGFQVTSYAVSFAAPSFDQAVADMQNKGTQIIFDAMDDGANRKLCDSMARRKFSVKAKVSTIVSMGDSVGNDYNDTCRNSVYITGESMPYSATSIPAIAEFRTAFAKYQPGQEVHQWALEAWAQAGLVADAVRAMGPAPTRKGLEDYFRGLRNYTGGGIMAGLEYVPIDYSKPTNEDCFGISRWLDSKGGWVQATNKFPFCYPDAHQYGTPALEQGN
ncbi:MAG: ABC transporter substrate-binding protein [Microthrixaceae bacterium]